MNPMVNPRSSFKLNKHLSKDAVDSVDALHATKLLSNSDRLCEQLWKQSLAIAEEALKTNFIQGIYKGKLSPTVYGNYTVQDAIYCYNATANIRAVADKSTGEVKTFIEARENSFQEYTEHLFKAWHIADANAIDLGKAAKEYMDYETQVATMDSPLYFLVAMLPCAKLWTWLAHQIKDGKTSTNLYSFWIEENSSELAINDLNLLQNFIDVHADKLDKSTALEVYQRCMRGEVNFFKSATGDYN